MRAMYLRGDIWWTRIYGHRVSTGCRDLGAAIARRGELEKTHAPETRAQFVYFARDGRDRIKIGFTTKLEVRMGHLRKLIGSDDLRLLKIIKGDRRTEKAILDGFARFCLGGEWFVAAQVLLDFIASQQEAPEALWRVTVGVGAGA